MSNRNHRRANRGRQQPHPPHNGDGTAPPPADDHDADDAAVKGQHARHDDEDDPRAELDDGDTPELVDRRSHQPLFTDEEIAEADHQRQVMVRSEAARLRWRESVTWMFEKAPQTDITGTAPGVIGWTQDRIRVAYQNRNLSLRRAPSLLLIGGTGTGKTHAAWYAIGHLARAGVITDWEVVTASTMYRDTRPLDGPPNPRELTPSQKLARWKRVPLLVIDDAGAPDSTPHTRDIDYQVINTRYENGLPVILTTNLPAESDDPHAETLESKLDARVYSRLVQMIGPHQYALGLDDRRMYPPDTSGEE